jgi:hypothetical protein
MEMYSWAGENHFTNRDLFYLVDDGTMSNGTYYDGTFIADVQTSDLMRLTD